MEGGEEGYKLTKLRSKGEQIVFWPSNTYTNIFGLKISNTNTTTGIVGLTETTINNEKELGKSVSSSSKGLGGHYVGKNYLFIPININSIVITIFIRIIRIIIIINMRLIRRVIWGSGRQEIGQEEEKLPSGATRPAATFVFVQHHWKYQKKKKQKVPESSERNQRKLQGQRVQRQLLSLFQHHWNIQKNPRKYGNEKEANGNLFIIASTSLKLPESSERNQRKLRKRECYPLGQRGERQHWNYQKVPESSERNQKKKLKKRECCILWQWGQRQLFHCFNIIETTRNQNQKVPGKKRESSERNQKKLKKMECCLFVAMMPERCDGSKMFRNQQAMVESSLTTCSTPSFPSHICIGVFCLRNILTRVVRNFWKLWIFWFSKHSISYVQNILTPCLKLSWVTDWLTCY